MSTVFIIRPFGKKRSSSTEIEIDFDAVERELLDPALTRLGATGWTTGEIIEAGNIRDDMFQMLLTCDLVVADISIHNANVFYELGIRHALRHKWTFLIRCRADDVPFDTLTDRYFEYDKDRPAASLERLVEAMMRTLESEASDSPVFRSVPSLRAQDVSRFIIVPSGFGGEAEIAREARRVGDLLLLASEAQEFHWEVEGLRVVGRALIELNAMKAAKVIWEKVAARLPQDQEANKTLGLVYSRLGDRPRSNEALARVLRLANLEGHQRADVLWDIGRNQMAEWRDDWQSPTSDPQVRRELALLSPRLWDAWQSFERGFRLDSNHYRCGMNASAMLSILVQLAKALPETWASLWDTEGEAKAELERMDERRNKLFAAVGLSMEGELEQCRIRGETNVWLLANLAELKFLTLNRPKRVAHLFRGAMTRGEDFHRELIVSQLGIFRDLGLFTENVEAVFEAIGPCGAARDEDRHPVTILFAGHRIDDPGRRTPRFTAAKVAEAREAIARALGRVLAEARADGRPVVAIAGGASGGDLLFHEACQELGIPSTLYLAMHRDRYVAESVATAGAEWVDRFNRLASMLPVLYLDVDESGRTMSWLGKKPGYVPWIRSNLWLLHNALVCGGENVTMIALWDGQPGTGQDGTEDLVRRAREHGVKIVHENIFRPATPKGPVPSGPGPDGVDAEHEPSQAPGRVSAPSPPRASRRRRSSENGRRAPDSVDAVTPRKAVRSKRSR